MRHMNKQSWMVFMTITQLQVFVEVAGPVKKFV